MNELPTDRRVLECIFEMYESSYPGTKSVPGRSGENDPYVAIDVPAIAARLGCSPELLFGRLYYYLDQKHRYKQDNGSIVPLFHLEVGGKRHAVQFPYLASILASFNQEHNRFLISLVVSILALVLSVASLVVSIVKP